MRLFFLMLFIAMPLLELALLIQLGQVIGFWLTILVVIGTAVIGTTVLRAQGFAVLNRANQTMARGEVPLDSVAEGILLLLGGAFLLTPGLITDTLGFSLLVPRVRRAAISYGFKKILASRNIDISVFTDPADRTAARRAAGPTQQSDRTARQSDRTARQSRPPDGVIEGEFERIDEHTIDPKRPDRS